MSLFLRCVVNNVDKLHLHKLILSYETFIMAPFAGLKLGRNWLKTLFRLKKEAEQIEYGVSQTGQSLRQCHISLFNIYEILIKKSSLGQY